MDVKWVKIKSWHGVREPSVFTSRGGIEASRTFCGRTAFGTPTDSLPDQKSCEACLRIIARLQDG